MNSRFLLLSGILCTPAVFAAGEVDFNRDIQPILSENCYHCHGPDSSGRKADLRLDTRDGALRTKDGITVVKPGDSKNSELVIRLFTDDEEELMPPKKSHRVLTAGQKELLRRWVDEGAKWGEHWAFVAPVRPEGPGNAEFGMRIAEWEKREPAIGAKLRAQQHAFEKWARSPIDRFVLDRLLTEGLAPSPEASPEKLCRRLHLDLTGLPPTPEELDAFLQSTISSPQSAVEALVDRLLASPRYGERMVWEWLDAARYADTNGYQGDPTRPMWYWRDWAIGALNRNMPFDQFTTEQIAGDLLPQATHDQLVATGFHRNHMINGEGGRIAEESRVEYVMDRVETTGTVWLGLTLNCCRCHDHKYDPLSQREYYQLAAYFNSIDETGRNDAGGLANPIIRFPSAEQEKKLADLDAAAKAATRKATEIEKKLRADQDTIFPDGTDAGEVKWETLTPDEIYTEKGTVLKVLDDGSIRASGPNPQTDDFNLTIHPEMKGITAFRIEALPDDSLVNKGPGRSDNGNFVLTEVVLQVGGAPFVLHGVSADFSQGGFSADGPFDGDQKTGWAVMPKFGATRTLVFAGEKPVPDNGDRTLGFRFSFQFGRQHTLGRFRISATTEPVARLKPVPDLVRRILAKSEAERTKRERDELVNFHVETNPKLGAALKAAERAKNARTEYERATPRTMIMRDMAKPRDTFILVKGAYNQYADKVDHGVPAKLPQLPPDAPKNRLALARWLVAPENPLTARVTVNRLWQQFFGTGLVKTADNFGLQGDPPSHPALLDWLAVELRESGWDMKHMVRLIVTSATYRQSSRVAPGMAERDPDNRLLARGPRHRLPSWMLRDQALAVSGLLVEKQGGPPVNTYQPPGIWEEATFGKIRYTPDHGEALYRRSLYIFWRRIVAPTMFFDVANRQNCAVSTGRTNTPLHALVTLNDTAYVEAARKLAERTLLEAPGDDAAGAALMFRRCTARQPADAETGVLTARLRKLRDTYRQDADAAKKLLAVGESKASDKVAPEELAAWTGVASAILNLDETLTKE